jgi:hypothetical protein
MQLLRKTLLLLLSLVPMSLPAQTVIPIATQQCVWRVGDDPGWSAAYLDESGWQPFSSITLNPSEPRIWVRCHLDRGLQDLVHPAVEVRMFSAYEVFVNGISIARNGNLSSGYFREELIRVFPVPPTALSQIANVLALRITRRYAHVALIGLVEPPGVRVGNEELLLNDRAGYLVALAPLEFLTDLPLIILGIIGLVLLGFSLPDRSRPEPIMLAVSCICVGLIFSGRLCGALMVAGPVWLYALVGLLPTVTNSFVQARFFFALAGKRMPLVYWVLAALWSIQGPWTLVELALPPGLALRTDTILAFTIVPFVSFVMALLGTAPFAAFWPWNRVPKHMRAIAGFCMVWGAVFSIFFVFAAISDTVPRLPALFTEILNTLFLGQAFAQLCAVAAVAALILRDQRQVALDRASLAGEMQAAGEIQQMLAPSEVEAAPGLRIDVAFRPMREVGGDFYLCRVLPDGRQRILLGDVSGKGAAAAMAATLLLGAAAARDTDSPAFLLAQLNRVLCENHLSGFATCLCADIAPGGSASIANAGQLTPYLNGFELATAPALPLGISETPAYGETSFQLAAGARLTFLSDGVVEARNPAGELFGFNRTEDISTNAAEEIANAAQKFGQDDDITVLTVMRLDVGQESSTELGSTAFAPA